MKDRPPRAHWARRLLVLAALLYASLWAWTGHRVGVAQTAWRDGRFDEAHEILSKASFWHVRSGRVHDALGVVDLGRGRDDEAVSHLAAARRGFFHPAAFGEEKVLADFLRAGHLEAARLYADHRTKIHESPSTLFYLGVAENGLNRLDDADRHLAAAAAGGAELRQRADVQRLSITDKRRTGRADYLFDRRGAPLAGIDLRSSRSVMVAAGLSPLLEGDWGPAMAPGDRAGRVRLTLDLEIQRAAEAALGAQRGALVVLDARDGGLLAAASQPATSPAPGGPAPPALARSYEPGSIMKMLTLSAALRGGVDVDGLFPFDCAGWETIDGIAFRDWMPHRRLASIDEAVAVSCNLFFGRLGRIVGRDRLDAELRRYGFDDRSGTDAGGGRSDFKFELGALLAEDGAHPEFALARRAEGLDSLEVTPIGAALLAAGLARGGSPPVPHLVVEKIDILGETTFRYPDTAAPSDSLPQVQAALLVRVMKGSVTAAEGTARRAAVDGLVAAMKTGTSGTAPPGYDAMMIGFAPADDPKIAWALVAEHAGKAEFVAARLTKEFLTRIKDRLP